MNYRVVRFRFIFFFPVDFKSLSRARLFVTPWTAGSSVLSPWDFPGKATGGVAFPSPGDLPNPGIRTPGFPALQADSLPTELQGKPFKLYQWLVNVIF